MATLNETMKTDIAHAADYVLSATGDIGIISGLENYKQALFHRLVTQPGSIVHRPNFGVGIKDFQNAPNSLPAQRQLALRIKEQFEEDPRTEEVLGVSVTSEDLTPDKMRVIVRVKPVGYDELTATFVPFGAEGVI